MVYKPTFFNGGAHPVVSMGFGFNEITDGQTTSGDDYPFPQKETPTTVSRLENLGMYWNYPAW